MSQQIDGAPDGPRERTAEAGAAVASPAAGPAPRKLRIVHVVNYIAVSGGLEKGVGTMIRRGSGDFEHVVLTIEGAREPHRVLPPGTRHINLAKPRANSLRFIWRLSRLLKELSPCVVHTRNWPGLDGVIAARLAGIRAVIHAEEGWATADPHGTNRKRILVRRALSRWTRAFVSVSKEIERWLTGTVRVRCPVHQIYNGIDADAYAGPSTAAEIRQELGLPADALLVGIVARLDPIKDHATLLRAFRIVRERFPKAELLCIGDGEERPKLEALLGPGIHLLGERLDVPRLLRGLDLFTLVSRNEGIPYTILEAMAAGVPVVASRVGGNPELVQDGVTGRLFPAGDVDALADAIGAYLGAAEMRRAHGDAGRARVTREFGTEQMVRAYERLWRSCAAHLAS